MPNSLLSTTETFVPFLITTKMSNLLYKDKQLTRLNGLFFFFGNHLLDLAL